MKFAPSSRLVSKVKPKNHSCYRLLKMSLAALTASAGLTMYSPVQAASGTWLNTGSVQSWSDAGNWSGGTIPGATSGTTNTDVATFNTALGTVGTSGNPVTIDAGRNIGGITFDTASVGAFTIGTTGGNALTLTSGGAIQMTATAIAGTETINAPIVLAGAGATYAFTNNSTSTGTLVIGGTVKGGTAGATVLTLNGSSTNANTISGIISNGTATSLAIAKSDAGKWVLSGTNTYTGGTNINAGTLSINSNNALGTGAITLNGGTLSTSAAITNTRVITIGAGGGTINVNGTGQYFFNTANTLLGSGALTVTGTGSLVVSSGNLRLAQTNTYSGNVTMSSGGILEYGVANAIASGATVTLGNQGELAVQNGITVANNITVTGGTNSVLSFENGTTGIYNGTLTLNANGIVGLRDWYSYATVRGGTISGLITGVGGLTVNSGTGSGGLLTLSNTGNNYQGGTTINSSTVEFTGTTAMPNTGAVTVNSGATLAVQVGSTGTLFTNGTSGNGTIGGLFSGLGGQSGGTVTLNSGSAVGLDTTNATGGTLTYAGNITNAGVGLTKLGTGTLTLSGTNTYTGQTTVSAGTLNYSGSLASGGQINVGVAGGGNAVMNVLSGANINMNNAHVLIGAGTSVSSGPGFVYQSGGTFQGGSQASGGTGYTGLRLGGAGQGAYGYYNMSGGSLNVSELDVAAGDAGFNGTGFGVMDMSGGTASVGQGSPTNNGWLIVNRDVGSGGIGILNLTGGTMTFTGPAGQFQNNWGTNGTAIINIGNATLTAANADINLNQKNNAGNFGEINLLTGGTLQAHSIASNATGTKLVNFNGGTLKASTATATFITTNNTGVNVFANGGTIDNNGVAITIPVGLLAATGNGVSSVAVTSGGSGYLGAPAVTFSGGGGTGAAGYATVSGGVITGIVITNPGTGYTSAPTITLTGGGSSNATIGTISTAANTSGGMIFQGAGTTTLTGASTYTGGTTISAGTLAYGASNALADTGAVNVNGGTLALGANSDTVGAVTLTSGSITGSTGVLTGASYGVQSGTISGILGGSGVLTKTTSGTVTLSGANTYTGATTVTAGTLGLGANNTIGSGSSVVVNGGTLALTTFNDSVAGVSLQSGNITGSTGVLTSASTYDLQSGSVSGILGGSVGATKTTAGTVTLSGVNTYTGATTVTAGTLALGANNTIASGSSVVVNGGTLAVSTFNDSVAGVSLQSGSITGSTGVLTSASTYDLQAGSSGAILGGSVGATKTTGGTVTLTAANTYTGTTTVSAGKVFANNTSGSATGSGAVQIQSTGTLAGKGAISGATTVQSGGTLSSGDVQSTAQTTLGGPGVDTITGTGLTLTGALAVNSGASLTFNLGAGASTGALNFASPNLNATFLTASGGVTFGTGSAISINLIDLTAYSTSNTLQLRTENPYLLIDGVANSDFNVYTTGGYQQNGWITGFGAGNAGGVNISVFDINGNNITVSGNYAGLQLYLFNGNIEVVPEPGTYAMILGGLMVLVCLQRRKNKIS